MLGSAFPHVKAARFGRSAPDFYGTAAIFNLAAGDNLNALLPPW
jgi:hypothetical protein